MPCPHKKFGTGDGKRYIRHGAGRILQKAHSSCVALYLSRDARVIYEWRIDTLEMVGVADA